MHHSHGEWQGRWYLSLIVKYEEDFQPRTVLRSKHFSTAEARAALVLAAFLILLFSPWWIGNRVLAPLDILNETYEPWASSTEGTRAVHNPLTDDAVKVDIPFRKLVEASLEQDGFIGWNRLEGGGRSIFDDPALAAGDWTLQLHRFLSFWKAWHLGLIAQLLIAGTGMLFFLRSRTYPAPAALLGGLLFVLCSQMTFSAYDRAVSGSFCWLPWVFVAASAQRSRRWLWPLVPVPIALSLSGGSFKTSLTIVVALGLVLPELMKASADAGRNSYFASAGAVAAGVGLAGFTIVPDAMTFFETGGFGSRLDFGPFNALLIPLQLFPTLLGSPRSTDLTSAMGLNLSAVAYFGSIPSIFAIRACFSRGCPVPPRRLVAAGLLIPLTPLGAAQGYESQTLFAIGGIWIFIWYLQERRYRSDRFIRWLTRVAVVVGVLWTLTSIAASIVDEVFAGWVTKFTGSTLGITSNTASSKKLVADLLIWNPRQLVPVVSVAVCLFVLRRLSLKTDPHHPPPDQGRYLILTAVLSVELCVFAAGWVTFADLDVHPDFAQTPDTSALQSTAGSAAAGQNQPGASRVISLFGPESAPLFPPNTLSVLGVPDVRAVDSSAPSIWVRQGEPVDARALARAGVGYAITLPDEQPADPGWDLVHDGRTFRIWKSSFSSPVYSAVPDPGAGVHLSRAPSNNRMTIETPPGATRVVVVENWNEGWLYRARGNRAWQPVRRTPEGGWEATIRPNESVLDFKFDPPRRRLGLAVTALSAIATVIALAIIARPLPVARLKPEDN